jgi:hypothetical protein
MLERRLGIIKVVLTACSRAPLVIVLLTTACSTGYRSAKTTHLAPTAKSATVQTSKPPLDQSTVSVIPNPYEDDQYQASLEVEATKQVLQARGYNVVENETTALLVAIPTLETNRVQVIQASPPPSEAFQDVDQPSRLLGSTPSLPNLAIKQTTTVKTKTNEPTLVIEAFRTGDWNKALLVNMLQLPPVWKVVSSLPAQYSIISLDPQRKGGPKTQFELPPDRLVTNATNR